MKIRKCQAEDLSILDSRIPSGGLTSFHRQRFGRQLDGVGTYLTAWRDGVPAGHLEIRWRGCDAASVQQAVADCPELNALGVWPLQLQSQGIGTALITSAERLVEQRGFHRVGLGVADDNDRARALYLRLGYLDCGIHFRSEWSWVDTDGVSHHESEPATFLVKDFQAGPQSLSG
ncbi:GNAT family N-acetyltransferase [Frankia sp. Cr1]|uniref:GNAT family N-acetyltransferase n=1 Tax=Frankia sp. Cr1 TaxID=3073931 RepID=UPI002AD2B376|nr:GNAT family N-acetyltransferase [Frankia sp. Cr1]